MAPAFPSGNVCWWNHQQKTMKSSPAKTHEILTVHGYFTMKSPVKSIGVPPSTHPPPCRRSGRRPLKSSHAPGTASPPSWRRLAKRCGSAAVGWNPRAVGEDEKLGPLWTKQLREGDLFMRYIEIPSKLPYRNTSPRDQQNPSESFLGCIFRWRKFVMKTLRRLEVCLKNIWYPMFWYVFMLYCFSRCL